MTLKSYHTTSPVSNYKRNKRLVTEGYDSNTCKYWFRIDLGDLHEFNTRTDMEQAIEREFAPKADLSLPQLPANVPVRAPKQPEMWKYWKRIQSIWGHSIPSGEVIALPASTTPKQLPTPKIAGLLPPVAGLIPGKCEGYLNAHWSPLATNGWVFEHRGHHYCPHCHSAMHKAMSYMHTQKTKEQQNTMGNQPNSPTGQVVDVYLNEEGENCEYCSHPIKHVYTIRLGDRQMNVGSECVRHLCSTQETAAANIIARRIKRAETQWRKKYPAPRDNETRKQYIERRLTEIKNALAAHKAYTALRVDHNVARRINARVCRIYKLSFPSNPYWEPFGNSTLTERRIQRIERKYKANRYDFIRPIWDVRGL